MNGELAQLLSLVIHGRRYLAAPTLVDPDEATRGSFQFVSSLSFARYQSKHDTSGIPVASSVGEWLSRIHQEGATRLWLIEFGGDSKEPEYKRAGFANAIPRAIQSDSADGFELWYPLWTVTHTGAKPWRVEYRSLRFDYSQAIPTMPLSEIKEHLRQAIAEAERFAMHSVPELIPFGKLFAEALRVLDSEKSQPSYSTLPLNDTPIEVQQIITASARAYVFGGMGSWNDVGALNELQPEYDRVTNQLYNALKGSIVLATNAP